MSSIYDDKQKFVDHVKETLEAWQAGKTIEYVVKHQYVRGTDRDDMYHITADPDWNWSLVYYREKKPKLIEIDVYRNMYDVRGRIGPNTLKIGAYYHPSEEECKRSRGGDFRGVLHYVEKVEENSTAHLALLKKFQKSA